MMTDWLFTWKGLLLAGGILVPAVIVGVVLRHESTVANVASVAGFAVSVLGFVVTIWTILDARQQIREAAGRAERAVAEAREQTRRAVDGIASQLRAADCAALRTAVEGLRDDALDKKWPQASHRCQDCHLLAHRLAHDHHLSDEEKAALRRAADDFQVIRGFINRYRPTGHQGALKPSHLVSLDRVIGLLAQIQGRLHHEPLRPAPEALQGSS
jgi:hypothetical protein